MLELQTAAKFVEDGKSVKEIRKGLNGGDVDILLTDNTFVSVSKKLPKPGERVALLAAAQKHNKNAIIVLAEDAPLGSTGRKTLAGEAKAFGVSLKVLRLQVMADGTKNFIEVPIP